MTDFSAELLDSIHSAAACMDDIRAVAERLAPFSAEQIEPLLLSFTLDGEDRALSRLLQVCSFNGMKLDPEILCHCIAVSEEFIELSPCFGQQDMSVVQPLLDAARAEALPLERKIFAARLAAELTVKFDLDRQPVKKVLWKLENLALQSHHQALVEQSLMIIEQDLSQSEFPIPRMIDLQLADLLPEHKPRSIVGGNYTVRRPIPKLGRNDPCHCGSTKKYKKCCYANDQELLRDASQYAGTTRSELKNSPGLVDDPDVLYSMKPHDLKKIKPSELRENQLFTGYLCALDYGFRELAFDMLIECERRPSVNEFDRGHFEDLLDRVLGAGDLELARKIRDHCGNDIWSRQHAIDFRFDLLENPGRFDPLEQDCRNSVSEIEVEQSAEDEPLIRLVFDCASRYPALAIVFARAAIASNLGHPLDNIVLMDVIHDARIDLDLEPWNDPAELMIDWIEDRTQQKEKTETENEEVKRLSSRLEMARADLSDKKRALLEMEKTLKELATKPEVVPEPVLKQGNSKAGEDSAVDQDREKTLQRLRTQVVNLKGEIGEQQQQRGQLRKMLEEERSKRQALSAQNESDDQVDPDEEAAIIQPSGKLTLPEYTDAFRKSCSTIPPAIAARAILAIGRFAAHDKAIWRQTKPIKRLHEHYRIRINIDYRMIVHWQPGKSLRILDVIPRQDLESWIKRHG